MNAIEIKGLTKTLRSKKGNSFKLDSIDLILPTGCIMGLIGENGAGKSTTIKLILEMLHKDSGEIRILGKDSVKYCKDDIGIVMDEVGFPECLNGKQISKVMNNVYKNWQNEVYADYLKRFNIAIEKLLKIIPRV